MTAVVATSQTILVVGGGISGIAAALEAAECGKDVVLVEKIPPSAGARCSSTGTFPSCAIRAKKLEEIAVKVVPVKKQDSR